MAAIQRKKRQRKLVRQGLIVVVVLGAIVGIVYGLASGGGGKPAASNTTSSSSSPTTSAPTTTVAGGLPTAPPQTGATFHTWSCPKLSGANPHVLQFPPTAPPMCIDPAKTYTATLTTNEGAISFTFDTKHTPKTANNWIVLALYHYFDGTSIFRIDPSIQILQSGSPHTQSPADPGPGYTIKDEGSGFKYAAGDIVMARTSSPNSASAQYFIVYGPAAAALDSQGTYVTFGHLTQSGLTVAKKIADLYEACPAGDNACQGLGGGPRTLVLISKVTITAS